MAAYAALVSVMHIIDNLQTHCRPPISLHREQAYLLTQKVTFLQEFLERYNPDVGYSNEADPLESRIARAAYAAEDAIESHILDHFTNDDGEEMSSDGLYEALDKVIEDMALIEKEVKEMETWRFQNRLHTKTTHWNSSRSSSSSIEQKKSMMVGVDDLLVELMYKLTSHGYHRQIIPIVGMGGSGKTTLALNIYQNSFIKEHFHICAWVTISLEYSIQHILIQLLTQLIREPNKGLGEYELGEMLYKSLFRRRYMIIMDDIWSIETWDRVRMYLPDNGNGSKIVITTRLTTLARNFNYSNSIEMKLLDEDDSWDLLSKTVFGEKGCPPGFEEVGKKIGRSCKGLPLSIVVVGRLLAESEQSIESWNYIKENLNAIVNLQDDGRCLQTLYISYKQLPVHLKSCFLYMGIYCEDRVIRTSKLIRLWVAEGFLKPISNKSLEDVARACLEDLIDRNLILIHKLGSTGSIKECKVHDLFRDLCIREAQKEGFYTIYPGREIKYRVSRSVMPRTTPEIEEIALSFAPLARSLILDVNVDHELLPDILRLLRIVGSNIGSEQFLDNMHQLVNSRFFAFTVRDSELPSLIWKIWNLKALIVSQYNYEGFTVPNDIWYMSHIRHLCINNLYLPDAPNVQDGIVLENLQTLATIRDFKCSEQVVQRIPNIRKLKIVYREGVDERFCLTNLDCLNKLESLTCSFNETMCQMNYPQSLKKLNLEVHVSQCWQDILDKIGALPLLEKLSLHKGTFEGLWETTEGQFPILKYLSLNWCEGLQVWALEASHFPRLEQLHIYGLDDLEEIPLDIEDIPTLRLIVLERCSDSIVESAKRILEEQEELYGEEETTLQIQVMLSEDNDPALERLSTPNFHVTLLLF